MSKSQKGKLVIAGIGIKLLSHITHEAKLAIEAAKKVFYISFHPFMDQYIQQLNPSAESLNYLYDTTENRRETYELMAQKVVSEVVENNADVCMVFYGHPCVFALPGRLAMEELRRQKYFCVALPAVSALDCVFSDLLLDSMKGYTCLEATDLVKHQRQLDISQHNIIWQPYMYASYSTIEKSADEETFKELIHYLLKFYPKDHQAIVYSASMYPGKEFSSKTIRISQLTKADFSVESTLVIPV